jgi:coproporphyrinogen III oxidase
MDTQLLKTYLTGLQARIVAEFEAFDGQPFHTDSWERPEGGGGISRLIEEGDFFERGGVNFSHVTGATLPASATAVRPQLAGRAWEAMGVSLVLHPRNPYCPTAHMNVRCFIASKEGEDDVWWFGGGMDMTPYYGRREDVQHFHRTCRSAMTSTPSARSGATSTSSSSTATSRAASAASSSTTSAKAVSSAASV